MGREKVRKEGLIKDAYELILRELQTVITLVYIAMVGIGMLFNHRFYEKFGINIFEYGDILDFLIAPFENIIIIGFTIGSLIVGWLIFYLDQLWKEKLPKLYSFFLFGMDKRSWYKGYRTAGFVVASFLYLILFAGTYGNIKSKTVVAQPII